MPVLINPENIDAVPMGEGITRQALITPERVNNDCIVLDRWNVSAGASTKIQVAATDLAWFQLLEGEASLDGTAGQHNLSDANVVFLPPEFEGTLESAAGAVVLYARVPDAGRFDPAFADSNLKFRCVDWRAEPTLDSEHDARTRIYLVTPTLFGTKAVKGEMIIYAPGATASTHHHVGAEHFQYIISGSGTALLGDESQPMRAGDTLYNYEYEMHNFVNDGDEDLVFVEYFVPAECQTIWVNPETVCTWSPTGKNIDGGEPSRKVSAHAHGADVDA
jgi:quercetin dioxygenase-like cupin family protein